MHLFTQEKRTTELVRKHFFPLKIGGKVSINRPIASFPSSNSF